MPIITAIAFLVVLLVTLIFSRMLWRGYRSSNWPTVEGIITESKVKVDLPDDEAVYSAMIRYEYFIHGKAYFGTNVRALNWTRPYAKQIEEMVKHFPPGEVVVVRYDPKHPDVSLLQPGITYWEVAMLFAFWVSSVVLGLTLLEQLGISLFGFSVTA